MALQSKPPTKIFGNLYISSPKTEKPVVWGGVLVKPSTPGPPKIPTTKSALLPGFFIISKAKEAKLSTFSVGVYIARNINGWTLQNEWTWKWGISGFSTGFGGIVSFWGLGPRGWNTQNSSVNSGEVCRTKIIFRAPAVVTFGVFFPSEKIPKMWWLSFDILAPNRNSRDISKSSRNRKGNLACHFKGL